MGGNTLRLILPQILLLLSLVNVPFAFADSIQSLTQSAEKNDPKSQYQLAKRYEEGAQVAQDNQAAFYWYQQSAENGYDLAKFKLSKAYINGIGTKKNIPQGLFWLIDLALKGNVDAQLTLGKIYQNLQQPPNNLDMAEVWYQIASGKSSAAEEAYSKILEGKYNARRAKQISYIDQLNSIFPEDTESPSSATSPPEDIELLSIVEYVITLILVALISTSIVILRRRQVRQQVKVNNEKHNNKQAMASQLQVINQQKKQINILYRELKKQQSHAKGSTHKQTNKNSEKSTQQAPSQLQLACTLFGFRVNKIPNEKGVKLRFKQLSKVYHPDINGSEDEMKRLNAALKIILSHLKTCP